jgi:hypothetical protein
MTDDLTVFLVPRAEYALPAQKPQAILCTNVSGGDMPRLLDTCPANRNANVHFQRPGDDGRNLSEAG